ncbi:hypothetical protein [Nocardia acidivorans]|uniref:hypothetical protein n=1 Tax=Nocardia acidivorans TaxID=404580 RepID=UPI00082C5051|nr:hypothetical protein [Nocardia acidivorans]
MTRTAVAARIAAISIFAAVPLAALAIPATADANISDPADTAQPWQHHGDRNHHGDRHHHHHGNWDNDNWPALPPLPPGTGSFGG